MSSRWQTYGKSLLIGFIPGVVLPVMFFFLFGHYTTATNRDILPPLNHPLELIGFFGSLIFALPGYLTLIFTAQAADQLAQNGIVIPLFDAFSSSTQFFILALWGGLINLLFWTFWVWTMYNIYRYLHYSYSARRSKQQHHSK